MLFVHYSYSKVSLHDLCNQKEGLLSSGRISNSKNNYPKRLMFAKKKMALGFHGCTLMIQTIVVMTFCFLNYPNE